MENRLTQTSEDAPHKLSVRPSGKVPELWRKTLVSAGSFNYIKYTSSLIRSDGTV